MPFMNNIVINRCFGGFGLSFLAAARLLELRSSEVEVTLEDEGTEYEWTCITWNGTRHDPLLVRVVRELGKLASGENAELIIIMIEGTRYRVTEYDGAESIDTPTTINWTEVS